VIKKAAARDCCLRPTIRKRVASCVDGLLHPLSHESLAARGEVAGSGQSQQSQATAHRRQLGVMEPLANGATGPRPASVRTVAPVAEGARVQALAVLPVSTTRARRGPSSGPRSRVQVVELHEGLPSSA
jgi:hypothetical protein